MTKKRVYSNIRARRYRQSKWRYFDNCLICQGMKNADKVRKDFGRERVKRTV